MHTIPSIVQVDLKGIPRRGPKFYSSGGCGEGPLFLFDSACRSGHPVLSGTMHDFPALPNHRLQSWTTILSRFDPEGPEEIRYLEDKQEYNFNSFRFRERDEYFPAPGHWTLGEDGRVYGAPKRDEYEIQVFGSEGKLERVIKREFESPPRSPEEMALLRAARDVVTNPDR